MKVYSSMERLSLHEEKRTPPPTKRSLSEEGGERIDSLSSLKSRDRSWLVGSPEMWVQDSTYVFKEQKMKQMY